MTAPAAPDGPALELQKAVYAALIGSADIQTLLGGAEPRVYDEVPETDQDHAGTGPENPDALFPYLAIGEAQDVPDLAEGVDGSEVFLTLHAFSREVGMVECKRIGAAVHKALHEVELQLDNCAFLLIERDGERYFTEPDGKTKHGVLTYRALVETV